MNGIMKTILKQKRALFWLSKTMVLHYYAYNTLFKEINIITLSNITLDSRATRTRTYLPAQITILLSLQQYNYFIVWFRKYFYFSCSWQLRFLTAYYFYNSLKYQPSFSRTEIIIKLYSFLYKLLSLSPGLFVNTKMFSLRTKRSEILRNATAIFRYILFMVENAVLLNIQKLEL